MSLQAKFVLGSACVFSLGIIGYVHYKQYLDRFIMNNVCFTSANFRQQLHQGVLTDIERRQRRKQENLYQLQKQIDLTKEIQKSEKNSNTDIT
ncbi:cytochrome c oxidase assembly factor-like [Asbolus verrucosus]|uniref:Cytochrome c oxidase assembly factor-like n=1 Tax=Asbolus verrucosus TaxID=1661398 RepID=A0A482WCE2_ASBVE|nr:cytochrome c oxidase assembly factor-like [Asbolus verrucosus]